ncbi:MAG: transposase [Candidatus Hydrogenedentes bacterium]|nr:transposase [Candidatus Hydrogenedentota bacterium]
MSRVARVVVPGIPHHVTQRGNRRADIFVDEGDREMYLRLLQQYAALHGLAIWAYCLMTNHVHLVAVPEHERSLGRALRDAHTVYAMYFNTRQQLNGHLWQGRFHSSPMDEGHLWAAVRYVERNPVRAGMVAQAEAYPWSRAAAHCGLRSDPLLHTAFPEPGAIEDWSHWLREEDDAETVERIRRQTHTGRPCGSDGFIARLETLLQRPLRPQTPGRKPKSAGQRQPGGGGNA